MKERVLIVGGGIAGLAAAFWLERAGAEVTVVERAHAFTGPVPSTGHCAPVAAPGHFITLKSHGVRVVREMGLLDACRARALDLRELRAHTPDGQLLRELDTGLLERAVSGMLLFRRSDLHAALYEAVRGRVDIRFGTEVRAIRALGEQVEVELPSGTERVDLLLGADGIHSRTRELVFGPGGLTPMGGHYVALSVELDHGLPLGCIHTYFGRGQFAGLLPRTAAEISALLYRGHDTLAPSGRDPASVREFLLRAYASFAPAVRSSIEALSDSSFVFMDEIAMVELPQITRGRIALLGDAAHCPTFMSGMGASLALQGADALRRALQAQPGDMPAAISTYAREITPIAKRYQRSARTSRRFLIGRSAWLAAARDAAIRWTPEWLLSTSTRRFYQAEQLAR